MSSISSLFSLLWEQVQNTKQKDKFKKIAAYLLFSVILFLLVYYRFAPGEVRLKPGQVSPRDITAPVTAVITDEKKTRELREQAASKVQNVYQEDKEALGKSLDGMDVFFVELSSLRKLSEAQKSDGEQKIVQFIEEKNMVPGVSAILKVDRSKMAAYAVFSSDEDINMIKAQAALILADSLQKPVTSESLASVVEQAESKVAKMQYADQAKDWIMLSVASSLRPNMIFNRVATEAAIEDEVNKVEPVQRTVLQGQIIIRTGDVVTTEHIEILQKLGLQTTQNNWLVLVGTVVLVLLTIWVLTTFISKHYPEIFREDRLMLLLALIFLIVVALARGITFIKIGNRPEVNALIGYLIPVSAGSMLVTILLDSRLAYFFTAIMAIYAGLMTTGNSLVFAFTALIGGVASIFSVSRINQVSDLARAGLYVAAANVTAVFGIFLITSNVSSNLLVISLVIAILNGFLSAVLMLGMLPYLETMFSVTSMSKLLELSNPNQPLLRKLLMEAPGTYHHSIMVGNLAEAAAPAVAANPLLVRVGALYHDIGKTKRPYFFVENQVGYDNPHEKIAPSLSALIITSHIKDGVELSHDKRLPRPIIEIIEQSHGTSLVKYFYSRAIEEDREGSVHESTFRYEGPKPQTKEAALIMLADTVEAAVRSMPEPTPGKIEGMVRRLIKEKLNDGQLEECDLTFRDLNKIADAFSKSLVGIYHKRIEYPEIMVRDLGRKDLENGNNNKQ